MTTAWRAVFHIDIDYDKDVAVLGPPGQEIRSPSTGVGGVSLLDTSDLTGDRDLELLTSEYTGGSGACSTYTVLGNKDGSFGLLFRRYVCSENGVVMRQGELRVVDAVFGGCKAKHFPCGWRRQRLHWNGGGWDVVQSRVIPYPD